MLNGFFPTGFTSPLWQHPSRPLPLGSFVEMNKPHGKQFMKNKFIKYFFSIVITGAILYFIGMNLVLIFYSPMAGFVDNLNAGHEITRKFYFNDAFPRDDNTSTFNETWSEIIEHMQKNKPKNKFFDPNEWIFIQNMPENPPGNLIILASRNVDPTSLRTKLTHEDMHKKLRFVPYKKFPLFERNSAVIFRANGGREIIYNRRNGAAYERVYKNIRSSSEYDATPFDATTNLTTGLPVKYRMPDGTVVIPTND